MKKQQLNDLTNEEATRWVEKMRAQNTDADTAEMLGITKVTMYKRLKTRDWKLPERALIEKLMNDQSY